MTQGDRHPWRPRSRSAQACHSPHHPIELYITDAKRWLLYALTTQHLKAFTSDFLLLQAKNNRETQNDILRLRKKMDWE
jgi:hypothetical protein